MDRVVPAMSRGESWRAPGPARGGRGGVAVNHCWKYRTLAIPGEYDNVKDALAKLDAIRGKAAAMGGAGDE